jgi:hypothetical protein
MKLTTIPDLAILMIYTGLWGLSLDYDTQSHEGLHEPRTLADEPHLLEENTFCEETVAQDANGGDLDLWWVTNLSEERKTFYLIATLLDPEDEYLRT